MKENQYVKMACVCDLFTMEPKKSSNKPKKKKARQQKKGKSSKKAF